jgi:hypothetical protein
LRFGVPGLLRGASLLKKWARSDLPLTLKDALKLSAASSGGHSGVHSVHLVPVAHLKDTWCLKQVGTTRRHRGLKARLAVVT